MKRDMARRNKAIAKRRAEIQRLEEENHKLSN